MENIIGQIKLIKDKYDKIEEINGSKFNVFSLLKLETDEVRTHSRIIAELLNPQGSHSQGAIFLQLFLKEILKEQLDQLDTLDNFKIGIEKPIGDLGRIDIYLKSKELTIVIENKIYAPDQENQLFRYYKYVEKDENYIIVYLTLDGKEPDDYTLKAKIGDEKLDKEEVLSISYETDIVHWLEKCIEQVSRVPQVRENLYQYQQLLRKLTGQTSSKEFIMEAKNIFYKNKNVQQIDGLEKAIRNFKIDIHLKFWDVLKSQLLASGITKEENIVYSVINNGVNEINKDIIGKYYPSIEKSKTENDFGIYFKIMDLNESNFSIYYGIKTRWRVRHGFRLFENGVRSKNCKNNIFKNIAEKINEIDPNFKIDNNWLGSLPEDQFDFKRFNTKGIYSLTSEKAGNEAIQVLTNKIIFYIEEFVKNSKNIKFEENDGK